MKKIRPYLALLILALIAFWPLVLHPTETLYSNTSDLLAQHLPAKYFLVRSLRETGEMPLWNPEQYAGSPFVHDIQVGLFYPPHLPLYFISEPAIGPFISWLLFAHVLFAGWLMYAYARHAGLTELAAFVAGVGFMLSPRWMMQIFLAGHVITQGICWVPLVLLCIERAINRKKWSWAVGGGMAYAMLILGTHPQWTFYASLLVGFWPLRLLVRERATMPNVLETHKADYGEPGRVNPVEPEASARAEVSSSLTLRAPPIDEPLRRRAIVLRWLAVEAIVVAIGLPLCAVQLLPTTEAAGESSRARGMAQSWSLDGAKAAATTLIGPIPDERPESIHWETRGGIGFTWAIFAIAGIRLGGRKALVPAIITGAMLAYALGGSCFIDRLPGFNNFRMPTRMLLTLAFPVAFLAGVGVQSLGNPSAKTVLMKATVFWLIIFANVGVVMYIGREFPHKLPVTDWSWRIYWLFIAPSWGALLLLQSHWLFEKWAKLAVVILLVDLLIAAVPYPRSKPVDEIYPRSPIIDYIRQHNPDGHRTYDVELQGRYHASLLGPGSPVASVYGVPSVRGYNPLDVARYRQFLAFIADNGERQSAFSGEFTHPVVANVNFRNVELVNLLGVRYQIESSKNKAEILRMLAHPEPAPLNLVAADSSPHAYDFLIGMQSLPSQYLYENSRVMPRAIVVSHVISQEEIEDEIVSQLTQIDHRHSALIEPRDSGMPNLPTINHPPGPARIRSHTPNEVRIDLDGRTAGLLVLTDPWYPGWVCRVDGNEVPIWKADYAFRGVMVPEGSREVVFHFEPKSYRRGKWISLAMLALIALYFLISTARTYKQRRASSRQADVDFALG